MVTNNKVLTVSYGTFSCTLEGFEDSFDTMKAIAEYFRDLAADDRYFGAEPPTPDAEMLARIAEREIERRVQARVDHGAIVLSAAAAASPAAAETSVADPVEETKAPAPKQDVSEEVTEVAEAAETIESDETDQAVVATLTDEAAPAQQAEPEEVESEETGVAAEAAETDQGADTDEDAVEDVMSQAAEERSETAFPVAEEPGTPIIEATDSDEIEDALEMDTSAETAEALPEAEDIVEEELAEFVDEAETLEDEIFAEADEGTAPVVAEEAADAEDAFADWDDEEDDVDPEYEVNSIAAKLERIRAVVSRVEEEPEDDFSEDEHAEDVPAEDTFLADTVHQVEEALAAEDQPEDTPQPLRARVVRMKRADFEEAVASGLLEAEPVEDDEDEDMSLEDGTSLSPEDEAELLAELAEVEAELDVLASYEDDADETVSEERAEAEAPTQTEEDDEPFVLTDAVETPDEDPAPKASEQLAEAAGGGDDLSRLMAKAESEMQEPVGKGRRQAIAHLRAAVKATKAEKEAGNDMSRRDHSEAYRDDLASVVRAVPGGASADKPRERSEAPLKLVAAQRVDAPAPAPERDPAPEVAEAAKAAEPAPDTAPRAPVRPRRVSAERIDREELARNAAPVGTSAKVQGDFQAYATSVGATRLPEVLEAAAAYLTFVEGHDRFSRPMLMRMARDANEDEFSREIGLRSFGQLLREKKIEKIAGGRFTAKPSIGFKPDDRAVG
ncbi:hypothetical protein [Shimia aestuarii]|uniref:Lipoprotein n=1 Tax=Shimia aestuarii TaxID=254406 RepID=A0A1I4QJE6_9RHOB|nr:hypothetical protein [Shimia aestuarii]SFM39825.1 hypothetical protein SAMN04488042_1074 [Shimia aestuarii]